MTELAKKTCTPCRGGIAALGADQAERLLKDTPGWSLAEDSGLCIKRSFRFDDFASAMRFVSSVGDLAENEGHP